MALKISDLELPEALSTDGLWVDAPGIDGCQWRAKPLWNVEYRRLYARLVDAIPAKERPEGKLDPAKEDEITGRCLAETVITGWAGFENGDEPIPYSIATAKQWMTEPRFVRIRRSAFAAAMIVEQQGRENLEADAGN